MTCYHPLAATQLLGGELIFHGRKKPAIPTPANLGKDIELPCNQCVGCRLDRATNWATRCLHESQMHADNCALTLTYSDDPNYSTSPYTEDRDYQHQDVLIARKSARELTTSAPEGFREPNIARVDNSRLRPGAVPYGTRTRASPSMAMPEGGTLLLGDHQKFIRKLRKKIKQPVRFYMCGEYGTKLQRPHYHYLIFGYTFPDKKYFKKSEAGTPLYRSELLETIWTHGHSWIGEVDYDTCAYVAGYIMKKITGEKAQEHYLRTDEAGNNFWLKPEFNLMSRNPGIGYDWWLKYNRDVLVDDAVYRYGRKTKTPRYYDKLLERVDPRKHAELKQARRDAALNNADDNTPARLEAKETVAKARINLKKRKLEKI